jgi:acetyl-CoA acetyltransferase family protein
MTEAFICEAVRTPIGKKNGTLAATRADDLAAHTLKALVERAGIDPAAVEDVVMGCVTQIGEQGWNIGRTAVLDAGFPVEVSGTSVNRMCGSSLQTTNFTAQAIMSGQADLSISAGVECMSRTLMGSDGGDISEKVTDRFTIVPQGLSAELIAEQWNLTRDEIDQYAWNSHQRALKARDAGWFEQEIAPIEVTTPAGDTVTFAVDETPRDSPLEKVQSLPAVFKPDGVVTAGNSSQICDGSAALLLASQAAVDKYGLTPRAKVISTGVAGVDPMLMLHGNPLAMNKALDRVGLTLDDMAVIEVNEAFAVVPLQTLKDLDAMDRMDDLNPNGGGISLGHPLGASGVRILTSMLHELERRDAQRGIASMCVGFGMAVATVIERV